MAFEFVLQQTIQQLTAYRNDHQWQWCAGKFAGPKDLRNPAIDWRDSTNRFEMPIGDEYWYRCRYTVPSRIGGIDVAGSAIHLRCHVLVPMELYVDGKQVFAERFWTDFRTPEVALTRAAKPGQTFELLAHFNPVGVFEHEKIVTSVWVEIEAVEDAVFHLETFPHEMKYCAGFHEIEPLAAEATRRAEKGIRAGRKPPEMLDVIRDIRRMMEPAAEATKRQRVHLVGHAHIDMNWLWDMDDTIDICRRDFTTMTQLMKEFPKFTFSQSQAAVYDIAERHFPDVFERMKKAVAKGNWEITAATWTEGDLNMANGEAFVRHLLYSRRYLLDRFGKTSRVCWEPDTFGHPANTPQLLKKAGISYYYHMRTSEGGPRYFHAETPLYHWEGLDGTRILVFTSFYGPEFNARDVVHLSSLLKSRHNINDAMFVYGVCDHGGGPTRRDIRRALALDALPTLPRLVFSTSQAFFDAAVEQNPVNLPVWKGEMNPIFDGCYTSHADIKRTNRQGENRLLEAEAAAALAFTRGAKHDAAAIETAWRTLCFNQFHDIFDGCAIHSTYDLAVAQNQEAIQQAAALRDRGLKHLSSGVRTAKRGSAVAVWNLLGFIRDDLVEVELPKAMKHCRVVDDEGNEVASQVVDGKALFIARDVPAMGFRAYSLEAAKPAATEDVASNVVAGNATKTAATKSAAKTAERKKAAKKDAAKKDVVQAPPASQAPRETDAAFLLSSSFLEVRVDRSSGCILHMLDKESGKLMIRQRDWSEGRHLANNLFHVEHEVPHGMSSWIIGAISKIERLVRGARVSLKSSGPVVDVLAVEQKTGASTIRQEIWFHKGLKRIDFRTRVDWQEESGPKQDAPMLKVSFLPELSGPSRVTWDIPYGNIPRVADGTEFAAQKWIDVSDAECGFSLLNDCKYGFSANGNTVTMTCIRTSYSPDPVPDRGAHEFNYSLMPHAGGWQAAYTVRAAAGFNSPLLPVLLAPNPAGDLPPRHGWMDLESEGALVTAFKKAEDSDALIVRIQETRGENRPFALKLDGLGARRVEEVSLVEDRAFGALPLVDGVATGKLGPYEVKTLRIWR